MKIRPASYRDLAQIEELHRRAGDTQASVSHLDGGSPVPQAALLRIWYGVSQTVSSLVPLNVSADVLLVAEEKSHGIAGFIQAEGVGGSATAWQILNLCVTDAGPGHFAKHRLLTSLLNRGLEMGVQRFHVRIPVDHGLSQTFLEQGFVQYATEQIFFDERESALPRPRRPRLRPAKREDLPAIYLLYLRTTPSQVAAFEGPSQKTWQATFAQGVAGRWGRDAAHQYVMEHPGVIGWTAIQPAVGGRPTQLWLMCEGHDPGLRAQMIEEVLAEVPLGPVSCVLRHYDSELGRCLQKHGFEIYGTQMLLVKDLGAKVKLRAAKTKKPRLVPAGVARSIPLPTHNQAQILCLPERRLRSSSR